MASDRVISLEEVKKNTTEKSCWLVVHGKVYDVTEFLEEHPGGYDIILTSTGADPSPTHGLSRGARYRAHACPTWFCGFAGKDATQDFEEIGHSNSAKKLLEKYYIGKYEVSEGELSVSGLAL
jgi:cytochrome b involved in lipid metabolism